MKISGEMLLDKRIVQRHIEAGLISREEYTKHINALADIGDRVEILNAEMLDVGVKDVEAKDTGETE
jgi:spore coat polysaccharide biosynthesis protein SpsF (cytidylyltransferase family)